MADTFGVCGSWTGSITDAKTHLYRKDQVEERTHKYYGGRTALAAKTLCGHWVHVGWLEESPGGLGTYEKLRAAHFAKGASCGTCLRISGGGLA